MLLLQLSAPEEAGANSAALQISDGLSNVVLLAAGGAAFAALGGGTVAHAVRRVGRRLPPGGLRRGVPADGGGGAGGGVGDYAGAGRHRSVDQLAHLPSTVRAWLD